MNKVSKEPKLTIQSDHKLKVSTAIIQLKKYLS